MEQIPPATPVQELNVQRKPTKNRRFFIFVIMGFILLFIAISAGIFLFNEKKDLKTVPPQNEVIIPSLIVSPTAEPFSCELTTEQCKTIDEIRSAIEAGNFEELANYFEIQTLKCTGSDQFNLCQGKPANTTVEGMLIGLSKAGEGGLTTRKNLIETLEQLKGPFSFQKFVFQTPSGELNYLSPAGMLYFKLIESDGTIKIKSVLIP